MVSTALVSVPSEQLEQIRSRYEYLRKAEQYRAKRVKETFQEEIAVQNLERESQAKISFEDYFCLNFSITFPAEEEGEMRWQEYGTTLLRLFRAISKREASLALEICPNCTAQTFGYEISVKLPQEKEGKVATIRKISSVLRHLLYPESTQYAPGPIRTSLTGYRNGVSGPNATFNLELNLQKATCQDFIVLGDMPLVFSYYRQIQEPLMGELSGRGQTVYTAVEQGDGESVIRRNDSNGRRLLVDDPEDIGSLITDYHAFRFVPDVNLHNSDFISRVPIDMDRPPSMGWEEYSEFLNDFNEWLKELGFKPRLRLTGGKGAHIILNVLMDRVAKSYSTPFPRTLKFETWIQRVGEGGLISAQVADFVKTVALAYGCYRKNKLGRNAPLTVAMHDLGQRYWNILADSSRVIKGMGIVSVGSIHHKSGRVCTPVTRLPERLELDSVLNVSYSSDIEPEELQPKFKSIWIQTVGRHPSLLQEPPLSPKDNPFSLIEEVFERYSWIPKKYVEMGSERFMKRYCWA